MFLSELLYAINWYLAAAVVIGGAIFLLIALRFYVWITRGEFNSQEKMNGKTVLITGCTSGIGLETARDIAQRGAKVIMACRNVDSANKIKDTLIKETKNPNIIVRQLDLASLQSIRDFAKQINEEESRLDVLIHNAGTAETFTRRVTKDGLEMTMGTNQYGPFLLTHLLIDLLKRSKPSRIVIVASFVYHFATLNLNNPNPVRGFPAYLYFVSKYANIVFSLELARRLEGTGVTANCLHPGFVDTGIWKNVPIPLSWALALIIKGFFKTTKQGAQTTVYAACSDEVANMNGKYFSDCQVASLTRAVSDPAKGKKYWEICEELAQLQSSDPKI
ncbi:retinol dehydrogenase 14 [Prorops nasuta]|uniref:retinol dehydrogenase 14 n=1 Tax=Prorops nasuta TaxID=863751 RepID=UPI0034CD6F88